MHVLVYAWCDNLVTLTMNRKVIIIIITYEINLHLAACAGRVIGVNVDESSICFVYNS